ncbi:MAG: M20/M25/M40 family metallo-hydrolase [Gemmatimonadota bacterium]|nr:MAG: M20/M25/M40 family metallo-hydrolase [Gemmatimonadota bacterium]
MTLRDPNTALAMVGFIDEHADEQLQYLIALSQQNSYSWNKAGTDQVAAMVLERIGTAFRFHRVVEQAKVGDLHLLSNVPPGEKSIVVLAHMDTVFPPEHPFRECWVDGDELHGPGTGDMKAGIATLVYAILALQDACVLDEVPLTVVLVGDEEVGAVTSRPIHEEETGRALACLGVEGAGANREVVVSRYGKMGGRLECTGKDQHVGTLNQDKASAVLELAHKTIRIEGLNGNLPDTRLNVGKVEGGLGPATVPAFASALVDIRWKDQAHRDVLVEMVEQVVSQTDIPACSSKFLLLSERPAWPLTQGTRLLADLVKAAGAELGQQIGEQHRAACSDSNFYGAAGVPTVDGLGPYCEGYHTAEELVKISTIKDRTGLLANSLLKVADGISRISSSAGER